MEKPAKDTSIPDSCSWNDFLKVFTGRGCYAIPLTPQTGGFPDKDVSPKNGLAFDHPYRISEITVKNGMAHVNIFDEREKETITAFHFSNDATRLNIETFGKDLRDEYSIVVVPHNNVGNPRTFIGDYKVQVGLTWLLFR